MSYNVVTEHTSKVGLRYLCIYKYNIKVLYHYLFVTTLLFSCFLFCNNAILIQKINKYVKDNLMYIILRQESSCNLTYKESMLNDKRIERECVCVFKNNMENE